MGPGDICPILLIHKPLYAQGRLSHFYPFYGTMLPLQLIFTCFGGARISLMDKNHDTITFAVSLIIKAAVIAAKYSGRVRKRSLKRLAAMDIDEKDKEILFLIDKVYQLETQASILLKRVEKHQKKPRYTLRERLLILWHMETFQIPRRKVAEHLGVSKSTVYRWLHKIQDDDKQTRIPANKTPTEIAALVWEIAKSNISCGRVRIANQLGLLNVFISASTVRNILKQPAPDNPPTPTVTKKLTDEKEEPKSIPAWYPNHVWSRDLIIWVRCVRNSSTGTTLGDHT